MSLDKSVLALPIYSTGGRRGNYAGVDNTPIFEDGQSGVRVLNIDVEAGISDLGKLIWRPSTS